MRAFVIALALLFVGTSSPADAGKKTKSLKLKKPAELPAGTFIDVTSDLKLDMSVEVGGNKMPMTIQKTSPYTIELLEVDGDRVERARIVVGNATENEPMGKTEARVTAGKTYLIAFGSSGMKITYADGKDVTADELKELQKEHDELGKGQRLRKLLVGRTFKQGKKTTLKPEQFADVFGTPDDLKVTKFAMRFDGQQGNVATFSYWVSMTSDGSDPNTTMSIDGTGTFTVDIKRVLPLTFTLDGPLVGSVAQGKDAVKITGTMSGVGTKTYRLP